jgi:hypothetical protein
MQSPIAAPIHLQGLVPGRLAESSVATPCPICHEMYAAPRVRRFGGKRVCEACWEGLMRLERRWSFRTFPRPAVLAFFAAEVAVRAQPRTSSNQASLEL